MSELIKNRQEILFLYEAKDCNPNGDPLDENRPRTDPETGVATVTDVRIKRTVRDYIMNLEPDDEKRLVTGREILIRDTFKSDGYLSEGADRASQFLDESGKDLKGAQRVAKLRHTILEKCVDARLFGTALPAEKKSEGKGSSLQITGPVQFSAFNRSLHRVAPQFVQQTAAFAGKAKADQKSFAERHLLPYALIAAYGVVNEVAATTTGLTDDDVSLLLQALWHGTIGLNTHSKIGHQSLLLLRVRYRNGRRLGALPNRLKLVTDKADTKLRSTDDYVVDVSALLDGLSEFSEHLEGIDLQEDARLIVGDGDRQGSISKLLSARKITAQPLTF